MVHRRFFLLLIIVLSLGLVFVTLTAAQVSASNPSIKSQEIIPSKLSIGDPPPDKRQMVLVTLEQSRKTIPSGAAVLSSQVTAASEWDYWSVNMPHVIENEGEFTMWYDGIGDGGWSIGVATSPNGDDWVKYAGNPVLGSGAPGEWDESFRGQAAFLLEGDEYKMWYSGGGDDSWQTGYATSTNGIDWNIYGGNPVLPSGDPSSWDEGEADGPAVINDEGTYKMWYHGCVPDYSSCSIGYATSPDGMNWTKYGSNPILTGIEGTGDPLVLWPTVVKTDGTYYMWYTMFTADFSFNGIGLATSLDGIQWTKNPGNPILTTGWEDGAISGQYVMEEGGTFKMWLRSGERGTSSYGIGYATSSNGIDWEMNPGNPVLTPGDPGLYLTVNYAHEWAIARAAPNTPITLTVEGKAEIIGKTDENGDFYTWEWPWDPEQPDFATGDLVFAESPDLITSVEIGQITGQIDVANDIISGQIFAPFGSELLEVRCEVWVEDGPDAVFLTGISADGGSYECDFSTVGWDVQPAQDMAVIYTEPDGDEVINIFQTPWTRVNYAHDWVGANYPAGATFAITVTDSTGGVKATATKQSVYNWGWSSDGFDTNWDDWSPEQPDIEPGDWVYFAADTGYTNTLQVGLITGAVDIETDSVSGSVYADWFEDDLTIECHPWGAPPNTPGKNSTAGPDGDPPYTCQWDPETEWNVQVGQDIAVMYIEPDGDRVIDVYQEPDPNLYLTVNYGHDWIEASYESGHTVWLTVTNSIGDVKGTASGETGDIPWWGGNTGFSTNYNVVWDGFQPDMEPGDWVYGKLDNDYTAQLQLGDITGVIDLNDNAISGEIYADWHSETLYVRCEPWGAPVPTSTQESSAEPDGTDPYYCQWDPGEWDILAGQDLAVFYDNQDGQWVGNVFRVPAPHLWINTWADGQPGEGGNFSFYVDFANDGDGPAENVTIQSELLGGLTYISDTSGLSHTGTGALGDPLVWEFGTLEASGNSIRFTVFAQVDATAGETITHAVNIETTTEYYQDDEGNLHAEWSGEVHPNNTDVNIGTWPWTWDPVPGSEYVYTNQVCNNGSTASSWLTMTDTLPLSTTLSYFWGQHPGWIEVAGPEDQLILSIPSIPGERCSEVYLRVALDPEAVPGQELTNRVTIAADNDTNPGNNNSEITHPVGWPHWNLSIHKDWLSGQLVPGGNLYYELYYNNNGNLPVEEVYLTSQLPANTTFVDSWYGDEYGPHYVPPAEIGEDYVIWDVGPLDNGAGGRLTIQLHVDPETEPGSVLTHTVSINSLPVEDDFEDNAITWVETIQPYGPNLRIDKQNYSWWGDQTLNYELRIYNLGTEPLDNFWITDTLPENTNFNGDWNVNHGGWYTLTYNEVNNQVILWGEHLDPGNTASIGLRANLLPEVVGQVGLIFTNQISAPIPEDIDPTDNQDEVTAFSGPDLFVEKTLAEGVLLPGEVISYKIRFGNAQHGSAHWWGLQGTAWLTDTLPAEVDFLHAEIHYCGDTLWCTFDPTNIDGNVLSWELWPIGASQYNEILVTVRISETAFLLDSLVNEVIIASNQPEVDLEAYTGNNTKLLVLPMATPRYHIFLPIVLKP